MTLIAPYRSSLTSPHPSSTSLPPSSQDDTPLSKGTLRKTFAAARRELSIHEVKEKSAAVQHQLTALSVVQQAECLHAFWPIARENEVDIRAFVDAQYKRGATVALPVVTCSNPDAPAMTQRAFTGRDDLKENRWGIMEPVDGPFVDPGDIDLVLIPALGAGRDGHRIGHGWGYYDRFLATIPGAIRIVLAFDTCIRDTVPSDAHDVPAHIVVTESGIIRAHKHSADICRNGRTA